MKLRKKKLKKAMRAIKKAHNYVSFPVFVAIANIVEGNKRKRGNKKG